ncbi:MAG: polysaccharide deacetylase family protein [Desulfobacterales bacterium]|nr:polysaccharide deacetylase family protein [Desulfobacterales bacterium]
MNLVSGFYQKHEGLRRLVRELAADQNALTLDIGCKKGDLSAVLAKSQKHLVALDLERHPAWQPAEKISFVHGNALFLPFRDASFDLIVAAECLQYIKPIEQVLAELHRVLKDNGRLIITFPEGGKFSTLVDPYNIANRLKGLFRKQKAAKGYQAEYLRLDRVLSCCRTGWRCERLCRRGSYIFILSAWLIDQLQGLRRRCGPSAVAGKMLALPMRILFQIMRLDFSVSYSSLSYNIIILLRKVAPSLEGKATGPLAGSSDPKNLAPGCCFRKGDLAAAKDLRKFRPAGIPILCYHNVSDTRNHAFRLYIMPVKRFARQMQWLKEKGYQAITLNTLYDYLDHNGPLPEKPVIITFDDGYQELKDTATPILARLNFPHVLFINTGKTGLSTDWVERAPDIPLLSRGEISAMVDRYGDILDFQAHGKTHLSMKGAAPGTIVAEVRDCIDVLEPITGRPVRFLAYPYGERDDNTPAIMRSLGLRCSFTVDQGLCRPGQDLHLLPRVEIFGNDFFIDFILKVRWGWSPIAGLRTILKKRYNKIIRFIRK